jgi:oligopeptide transport system substrate-binding protein
MINPLSIKTIFSALLTLWVSIYPVTISASIHQKPGPQDIFRFNAGSEPETLDPAKITGSAEMKLADMIFEGLCTYHPKSLKPIPGIAKKWTISDDGLKYQFTLRPSQWADGTNITAQTFIDSWTRLLSPQTGASYASLIYMIKGAEDFHQSLSHTKSPSAKDMSASINLKNTLGLKALSTYKLEVELIRPCPYFLDLCAFVSLYPVPMHIVKKHGEKWSHAENIVGNGAFELVEWKRRQGLSFRPNPKYHDHSSVKLKWIEAKLVDDNDTAYKLFLKGELDWISNIPLPKQDEATWHPHYYAMPYMGTYFYRFNVTQAPFNNANVRRAFSMSIDRKLITENILKGGEKAAAHYCPKVSDYDPISGLEFNPDLAKSLLRDAGYSKDSFPEVEIFFNTSENHKKVAEAISQMWKEHLGVKVSLRNTEWKVFLNEMKQLKFSICRSGWIGDYNDPSTFFDLFHSKSGNNRTGWKSETYDNWLEQATLSKDPMTRMGIYQKMERLLVEKDCVIMPIYIYVNKGMISPRVRGWFENIRDVHPMKHIWLEKDT